jgi:hypothetical protein
MYFLLCKLVPKSVAGFITALWYTILIILTYALSANPAGEFRYLY